MSKKATRPRGLSRINFDLKLAKIKDLEEIVSIRTNIYVIATLAINTLEIKIRRNPLAGSSLLIQGNRFEKAICKSTRYRERKLLLTSFKDSV